MNNMEMNDIYYALMDGLRGAEALLTWQTGNHGGYEMAQSRIRAIKEGIKAHDRLSQKLRDGRMHIDDKDICRDDAPKAANLETPDDGHKLCDLCAGVGVTMVANMYPSGHTEVDVECEECHGSGQVEIEETKLDAAPLSGTTKE